MKTRSLLARIALGVFSSALLLMVAEGALRLVWSNPYVLELDPKPYFRLHRPAISAAVSAEGLYERGAALRFATDADRAIRGGSTKARSTSIALGGSSTESALVPEGQRWTDLLPGGTRNFGVSANSLVESYWNLRFLIGEEGLQPERVFVMHSVNDLRALLIAGAESFSVDRWRQAPVDLFSIDNPAQTVAFGISIRQSSLLSFIRFRQGELGGRVILPTSLHNRDAQMRLPTLGDDAFVRFREALEQDFLPMRTTVFLKIAAFAQAKELRIAILSQPNAYRVDYRPFDHDLRLYPLVDGKKMTLDQAAETMTIINRHSLLVAQHHGWDAADVAGCFSRHDPSNLFYDSVHLTPEGCRALADCVADELDR